MVKLEIICLNAETLLSLFDTYIGSILNYGCEVCGFNKANSHEIKHMQFCKRILGVKRSTTNMMIYSELGSLPFLVTLTSKQGRYLTFPLCCSNTLPTNTTHSISTVSTSYIYPPTPLTPFQQLVYQTSIYKCFDKEFIRTLQI